MFEFQRPRPRSIPADHRPCDLGYSMFGIHVPDFDAALARIERFGGVPLTEPIGDAGSRRMCLRDPDGILVELMEDRIFTAAARLGTDETELPALASVTISVRSIDEVRRFWGGTLHLKEVGHTAVHQPIHDALWGMDGASKQSVVFRAGEMALEFVRYSAPVGRPRPAGYLISDLGVLNVALGSTNEADFQAAYARAASSGFPGHIEPWTVPGVATVTYLQDPQGLSVELLHVEPEAMERMGFRAGVDVGSPAPPRVRDGRAQSTTCSYGGAHEGH
jgi:catechol 2,3-dioxygenase-like lactoylglutathione lyase family enzyme